MKAVVVHEHGGLDKLSYEEVETPSPAQDEVLVQVKACALNHLDIWVRKGVPGQRMPLPMIPGSDVSGVVKKTGALVRGLKAGDRVVIAPGISCGRCIPCLTGRDNLCAECREACQPIGCRVARGLRARRCCSDRGPCARRGADATSHRGRR